MLKLVYVFHYYYQCIDPNNHLINAFGNSCGGHIMSNDLLKEGLINKVNPQAMFIQQTPSLNVPNNPN